MTLKFKNCAEVLERNMQKCLMKLTFTEISLIRLKEISVKRLCCASFPSWKLPELKINIWNVTDPKT